MDENRPDVTTAARWLTATTVAALLAAAGCSTEPQNALATATARPELAMAPCEETGPRSGLLCGRLPVPEDPARPVGRRIELNIVVAPAQRPGAEPAAIFVLEGGPGVSATGGADFYLNEGAAYRERHDIVMADLRGTGGSNPLHCGNLEGRGVPLPRHLEEMYPVDEVKECRERLATDADLRLYNTANAVEDLEAVRRALAYTKIDLQAISYGTRLATEYIRRYPGHVRTLTAIGSLPPAHRMPLHHAAGFQRAFDLLLADCEAQAACREAFPDLRERWTQLLEKMAEPMSYRYANADLEGGGIDLTIQRDIFVEELRSAMYVATVARSLPLVVDAASRGDFGPFLELALPAAEADSPPFLAEGAYLSFTCTDDVSRIDAADIAPLNDDTYLGDYRVEQQVRACELWPSGPYPAALDRPVEATVPALLVTGERDPITPPSDAERVSRGLPNSRVVIVPHAGHLPFDSSDPACIDRAMLAFLASATVEGLDLSCIDALEPPPFVLN